MGVPIISFSETDPNTGRPKTLLHQLRELARRMPQWAPAKYYFAIAAGVVGVSESLARIANAVDKFYYLYENHVLEEPNVHRANPPSVESIFDRRSR